jgi:hypothetical protein
LWESHIKNLVPPFQQLDVRLIGSSRYRSVGRFFSFWYGTHRFDHEQERRERMRDGRYRPSGLIEELEVALASVVMSTQSSDGEEVTMETGGGTSRRWQDNPRDRTRFGQWRAMAAVVNLVTLTTAPPHLLFIALRDGDPPATSLGWASPIRTRDQGLDMAVGPSPVEIKTNILPLDLSSLSSFFNFLLKILIHSFLASFLFYYRLVHRTV